MALSVALGWWAVGAASATTAVWSASTTLTPGDSLEGNVVSIEVTPALAELYVPASEELAGVVDRTIGAGELVPAAAVVPDGDVDLRSIVVPSGSRLPADVVAGSVVDLWLTPKGRTGEPAGAPTVVVADALVSSVTVEESAFAGNDFGSVEILVAADSLPAVISAMADGGTLVVVPHP